MQRVQLAIDILASPHVQDNKYRMGSLGASDVDCAIRILQVFVKEHEKEQVTSSDVKK